MKKLVHCLITTVAAATMTVIVVKLLDKAATEDLNKGKSFVFPFHYLPKKESSMKTETEDVISKEDIGKLLDTLNETGKTKYRLKEREDGKYLLDSDSDSTSFVGTPEFIYEVLKGLVNVQKEEPVRIPVM